MILRAKQEKDVWVIELEGHLDFEATQRLEETCTSLAVKNPNARLVLNLEKLRFVGSSGINHFVRIVQHLCGTAPRPRLCNLSVEFQKIFKAFETNRNPFMIHESEAHALASFDAPEPEIPARHARSKRNH